MVEDPLLKIVNAARVSFSKQSSAMTPEDEKLIKFLQTNGHTSTFRHSYFTFRVRAPLYVMRQWWKYQVGSDWSSTEELGAAVRIPDSGWNEVSGRYIDLGTIFHVPESFRGAPEKRKQGSNENVKITSDDEGDSLVDEWTRICNQCRNFYDKLVYLGVAKEQARGILPATLYTECVWTVSLQTVLFFLSQRLDQHAQYEIRQYAVAIQEILEPILGDLVRDRANDVLRYQLNCKHCIVWCNVVV